MSEVGITISIFKSVRSLLSPFFVRSKFTIQSL